MIGLFPRFPVFVPGLFLVGEPEGRRCSRRSVLHTDPCTNSGETQPNISITRNSRTVGTRFWMDHLRMDHIENVPWNCAKLRE